MEIKKIRAQANVKKKILDVKMIEEPQNLQEIIQNEKGDGKCARSDRTEFEDNSME